MNGQRALERFEAAARDLRDAASAIAAAPPAGLAEVDRLGVAVAAVHTALDIVRQAGQDGDSLHDE